MIKRWLFLNQLATCKQVTIKNQLKSKGEHLLQNIFSSFYFCMQIMLCHKKGQIDRNSAYPFTSDESVSRKTNPNSHQDACFLVMLQYEPIVKNLRLGSWIIVSLSLIATNLKNDEKENEHFVTSFCGRAQSILTWILDNRTEPGKCAF